MTADQDEQLRVGAIRAAIEGLPDDAPVFVTVCDGPDLPVTYAKRCAAIIDPPDQDDPPWITRPGLELWADVDRDSDGEYRALVTRTVERRAQP